MADSKISNLPAGTEPLTGTEQIAIVQSGTTKMVDVNAVATTNNFATKDLTFTGNRSHDTNGNTFYLQTETTGANKSYIYTDLTDAFIGFDTNSVGVTALATTLNWNSVSRVTVKEFETVINDSPDGDFNFRVEGLTDTNLLFTDASTDFVGVGTNLPLAKVDVHAQGALSTDVVLNIRNSTDTADILSINGDGSFIGLPCEFQLAVSDETTDLTTGTAKITFRMPYAMTLTDIRASVTTAPTGSTISVGVNQSGTTILSTDLSIDISEKTSTTAAVPPVISTSALTDDAEITIDIDQIGSTIAGTGLKVTLIGTRA